MLLFKEGCRALGGEEVSMYYTVADVFCHLIPLVGCFVTLMATKAKSERVFPYLSEGVVYMRSAPH